MFARRAYRELSRFRSAFQRYGLLGLVARVSRAIQQGGLGEVRRRYGRLEARPTVAISGDAAPPAQYPTLPSFRRGSGGLEPDGLRLGDDYGVDQRSWSQYLGCLVRATIGGCPDVDRQSKSGTSLLVLVHADPPPDVAMLRRTLASVRVAYGRKSIHAAFCIVGDLPAADVPWLDPDNPVRVYPTLRDLATQLVEDTLVLFLKPGDEVHEELPEKLLQLGDCNTALMLMDLYFEESGRSFPLLMHAADPVHGLACDYFHSRFAVNSEILRRAVLESNTVDPYGVARSVFRDAQRENPPRLSHLAVPLVRCSLTRESVEIGRNALLERAEAERTALVSAGTRRTAGGGSVSVVICTKDKGHLLRQLVVALDKEPLIKEILIVSNQTTNLCAIQTLELLSKNPRVTVLRYDNTFNFSRQSNLAARYAVGQALLFINDDIVPVIEGWLEVLHGWLASTSRRIVGPLLLYPDESVQHGGMFLGFRNVAGHTLRGAWLPDGDYGYLLSAPRRVSCLTGAAMLVGKSLFDSLNGFDPFLGTYLQDVDLCLRAVHSGADLIFDPRAVLLHMESVSMRPGLGRRDVQVSREREYEYFSARWGDEVTQDRYLNPLFDPGDESLRSLRW